MRFLKSIAVTALLLLSGLGLAAQTRTVSGKVIDATGQPVPGVGVVVDGTTNGTMTAMDGSWSLRIPSGDAVLNFSSLGYVTQSVKVGAGQSTVNVTMEEDNMVLEETIVVGYGTQKKVNLTGAVTAVESKELENRASHNLTNMLQGQVPGLNITTSKGQPGAAGSLNIRGYTSINGGDPLVLVDGVESDMSMVNPNDVESISVIKDASAAAVYGTRGAWGVILITTKSGKDEEGNAVVTYSGRMGWERPTTSTDYETRGYWSVYTINKFWAATGTGQYLKYNDHDMQQLLLRVNDTTENPERPWVVRETRNGKDQWLYYGNNDWWHMLFNDSHPVQQHSLTVRGGSKRVRYFLSGAFDRQTGIIKERPDVFTKYNLRSKVEFDVNKYIKMSNNTSFYHSVYDYPGVAGEVENAIAYSAAHALPIFPQKNPDGSWVYASDLFNGSYNVANGRHIMFGEDKNVNLERKMSFMNTTEIKITPVKPFTLTANFTYHLRLNRDTNRGTNLPYRKYPDEPMLAYTTGAGLDYMQEDTNTYNHYAANVFGTYEDTFGDAHHLTVVAGYNYELYNRNYVMAYGENLVTEDLSNLRLIGTNADGNRITNVDGLWWEWITQGIFARLNYDYKGRYLFEISSRYDGSSRFMEGHRWSMLPSGSVGWRISEEPFFKPLRSWVDNLKIRASYGTLGNTLIKNANNNYYPYLRTLSTHSFAGFNFGEGGTTATYSSLSAPNASDMTWEKAIQYNLGLDLSMFRGRLDFTGEVYIRDTKDMLTSGKALPSVYGADEPKQNAADLRTKGYELSLGWRDTFKLFGRPFGYQVKGTLSDYRYFITKFDNPDKVLNDYYEGQRIGEIWGFVTDKLFESDEEALEYTSQIDMSYINKRMNGGWLGGDVRYIDLDGDNKIGIGTNTVDNPGDRKIIGNSLPSLSYGLNFGFDYMGLDVSVFFQGTGNHYWYPSEYSFAFWGPFSQPMTSYLPKDFLNDVWDYDNKDAYFPRARGYAAYTGGAELYYNNTRYLQNLRYLRLKNLTIGYTLPAGISRKIGLKKARIYFSGENLAYWSPFKEHSQYIDPEGAFDKSLGSSYNRMFYPWQKTYMFGLDITFGGSNKTSSLGEAVKVVPEVREVVREVIKEKVVEKPVEKIVEKIVEKPVSTFKGEFEDELFFVIGKSELRPDEAFKLGRICRILEENPNAKIAITGYADSATGTAEKNLSLSQQRAKVVADMLQRAGITADRITSAASGSDKDASASPESNRVAVCIIK